ncbi:MAG: hemolysin family protein [Bacteroidia bacterium]|nr:hemolysin family protein [Bacteroidia bacterium]
MELGLAILMLALSFFFSGMEIAFLSANRLRIELRARKGSRAAKLLSNFRKRTSQILITILIGNNLALVIFANTMDSLTGSSLGIDPESQYLLYTLVQTIITTLIVLVMAEYIPKAFFRANTEFVVYPSSYILNFFYVILYGPVWLVNVISKFLLTNIFRVPMDERVIPLDHRDLDNYLQEVMADSDNAPLEDLDTEMLSNALAFRNTKARECMIPRTEIEAAATDISVDELLDRFLETQLSKIIIYEESLDNVKGMIHSSSMFQKPSSIRGLIQPVIVVPETMPANEILFDLTKSNRSVAIVVDEFGGTSGMITVEDLVEEVFGEIEDEHDNEKEKVVEDDMVNIKNEDGSFTLGARLEIDDLNEEYPELSIPEEEYYTTLGGWILYVNEDIPEEGEIVEIAPYHITVLEAMQNRVVKVRLEKFYD